jgi:hypothetical protein
MLRRYAEPGFKSSVGSKGFDQWRHFYGFWTGANYSHYANLFFLSHNLPPCVTLFITSTISRNEKLLETTWSFFLFIYYPVLIVEKSQFRFAARHAGNGMFLLANFPYLNLRRKIWVR